MSKTSLGVVNILVSYIKNKADFWNDAKKPNGGLYKFQRPNNSVSEDIVVNSLPLNREAVQEGILNVNLYVPNLVFADRPDDKSQPDTARLTYLANLFNTHFGEFDGDNGNYTFIIQQDNIFQDENNQHYINFRIEFSSVNI